MRAWQEAVRHTLQIPDRLLLLGRIFLRLCFTVAFIPATMSKVVRSVKNVTKGYSSVQVKVRNGMRDPFPLPRPPQLLYLSLLSPCNGLLAFGSGDERRGQFNGDGPAVWYHGANYVVLIATSNDPWGPTGTDMSEIAAMTFGR